MQSRLVGPNNEITQRDSLPSTNTTVEPVTTRASGWDIRGIWNSAKAKYCEKRRNSQCYRHSTSCRDNMDWLCQHTGAQFDGVSKEAKIEDIFCLPNYPSALVIGDEDYNGHSCNHDARSCDSYSLSRPQGRAPAVASGISTLAARGRTSAYQRPRVCCEVVENGHLDINDGPILTRQPERRPVSQEQLIAEVEGIYARRRMVEVKCIEVDEAQNLQSEMKLSSEQWQALIALHRTFLHEHHDFFPAWQYPSVSQALQRLESHYGMPARVWTDSSHSLSGLRQRLLHLLEYKPASKRPAYPAMTLSYNSILQFEDTQAQHLGSLSRYRAAIEDDDFHNREIGNCDSKYWYSKAVDSLPVSGSSYQRLKILAPPNPLQQLRYYIRAIRDPTPFKAAREHIAALFDETTRSWIFEYDALWWSKLLKVLESPTVLPPRAFQSNMSATCYYKPCSISNLMKWPHIYDLVINVMRFSSRPVVDSISRWCALMKALQARWTPYKTKLRSTIPILWGAPSIS